MLPQAMGGPPGPGGQPAQNMQSQQMHLAYMQQYQQAQLRQQVAYMQQAMMGGPSPYPMPGYPGAAPYMGGMPMQPQGGLGLGLGGKGKGKFSKGSGFGGKGKGKGKGKRDDGEDGDGEKAEGDEETERVIRIRKDEPPIVKAQREARERAEKVILDKLAGRWVDEADAEVTYTVEGNTVSVANKSGGRVFHNRLSMYGVEFCWNAKRFWHDVNLKELYSAPDEPEKVEWNPGKGSPGSQIVWLRAPPEPEKPEKDEEEEAAEGQKAAEDAPSAEASAPSAEAPAPAAEAPTPSAEAPADA